MTHTPEWYARSLSWCEYVLTLCERRHTDDEISMSLQALSVDPESRQLSFIVGIDHASFVR